MASRSLDDLVKPARDRAVKFLAACEAAGIDVLIYCTYRSPEEQDALYAQGRGGGSGNIVTNARGGSSWHNYHCAFDFVPLVHGKPAWNDKQLYLQCGQIGEAQGLEWAGRWSGSLRETAHLQYTGGARLAEVKAGKVIA